jgi:hypothetical protein
MRADGQVAGDAEEPEAYEADPDGPGRHAASVRARDAGSVVNALIVGFAALVCIAAIVIGFVAMMHKT